MVSANNTCNKSEFICHLDFLDFIPAETCSIGVSKAEEICIIHFNDVYNVEEQKLEPIGGASRFKTAVKSFSDRDPIILFSGDALAPSIMSSFTQGEQMITVLNQIGVHCAVYGNHDFDFGLDRLIDVKDRTSFPWLMSNVIDDETSQPLADGKLGAVVTVKGWKIGLLGFVEEEWLSTLATINKDEVTYFDFVQAGKEYAKQLKNQGCDIVIALTHMRTPNDIRLAENVQEIDLILGGHDHVYEIKEVNKKCILKSGTDFREFSVISVTNKNEKLNFDIERVEITSKFDPDPELSEALLQYEDVMKSQMDLVLGAFAVDLDGRFCKIRTEETNLGNFIADVILASCNADITILNSGTLRSDRIHKAGDFTMRDLATILPMLDSLVVIEVIGAKVLDALENGVSQYPRLEGRFPQVAGVSFAFNPDAAAGKRIYRDLVKVGDEYLDKNFKYRVATKAYISQGKDGYDMFADCPVVQDEEQSPLLATSIQNHFKAVKLKTCETKRHTTHRQSLLLVSRRHSAIRLCSDNFLLHHHSTATKDVDASRSFSLSPKRKINERAKSVDYAVMLPPERLLRRRFSHGNFNLEALENDACKLSPKIEGRIMQRNDQTIEDLKLEKRMLQNTINEENEETYSRKNSEI